MNEYMVYNVYFILIDAIMKNKTGGDIYIDMDWYLYRGILYNIYLLINIIVFSKCYHRLLCCLSYIYQKIKSEKRKEKTRETKNADDKKSVSNQNKKYTHFLFLPLFVCFLLCAASALCVCAVSLLCVLINTVSARIICTYSELYISQL